MKVVILLTGCINPDGMTYTFLDDKEKRKEQYVNAIRFYLSNTHYPIVFVENSGTDISHLFTDYIRSGRMECLTFQGNEDKERGKGYGECNIIEYALNNSLIIRSSKKQRIAKITGRLIIRNVSTVMRWHTLLTPYRTTICSMNSDLSFPDSRFIIASKEFYCEFLKLKECVDDSKGNYFEHALCDTIKRRKHFSYCPYFIMPEIVGISGSTGEQYSEGSTSIGFSMKYARYALYLLFKSRKFFGSTRRSLG